MSSAADHNNRNYPGSSIAGAASAAAAVVEETSAAAIDEMLYMLIFCNRLIYDAEIQNTLPTRPAGDIVLPIVARFRYLSSHLPLLCISSSISAASGYIL